MAGRSGRCVRVPGGGIARGLGIVSWPMGRDMAGDFPLGFALELREEQ